MVTRRTRIPVSDQSARLSVVEERLDSVGSILEGMANQFENFAGKLNEIGKPNYTIITIIVTLGTFLAAGVYTLGLAPMREELAHHAQMIERAQDYERDRLQHEVDVLRLQAQVDHH